MKATDKRVAMAAEQVIHRYLANKSHGFRNNVLPIKTATNHSSQHQYDVNNSSVDSTDGFCVIESTVHCEHCGYCRSHGH